MLPTELHASSQEPQRHPQERLSPQKDTIHKETSSQLPVGEFKVEEEKKPHDKIPNRLPPIEKTHPNEPVKIAAEEKKNAEVHHSTVSPSQKPPQAFAPKVTITEQTHNSPKVEEELTKRSDDSEFMDWRIATVKSGKFVFNPAQGAEEKVRLKQEQEKKKKEEAKRKQMEDRIQQKNGSDKDGLLRKKSSKIKVEKTVSLRKKEAQEDWLKVSEQKLINDRFLRKVFEHFCKNSHISSIKSSLFQEKSKAQTQMDLHKWMIFAKEYALPQTLFTKQSDKVIVNLFRKATTNRSRMRMEEFAKATMLLFAQLTIKYEPTDDGLKSFLKEVMHCSTEQQCFQKLASLKFTSAFPQIDYSKSLASPKKSQFKQNVQPLKPVQKSQQPLRKSRSLMPLKQTKVHKMGLNPVIAQAKRAQIAIIKPNLTVSKIRIDKPRLQLEKQTPALSKDLLKYFQGSKDEILESYFQSEGSPLLKH